MEKTCTLKIRRHWWKKLKKTQINGNKLHFHGLEEFILLKCLYYTRKSRNSMQFLSKFQRYVSQNYNYNLCGTSSDFE